MNFRIGSTNTLTMPTFASTLNPGKVTCAITPSTGSFTGTFTLNDSPGGLRTVPFHGWLVPGEGKGYGYFMLPQLADPTALPPITATTSPILSGRVVLDAAQP